jgi:tetratricopeptide (TPR) repeat protein
LAAPKDAKKAYERAAQEMLKKRPDFAKAARELERAVKLYPRYAAAWHLLGTVRLSLSDPAGARQALQQAIAVNPKYDRPYLFLALLELNLARFTEAVGAADQALRLNPSLMEAHFYRAMACYHLGQRAAAKDSILVIVRSGEDKLFPWVHALLGDIHILEGNLDHAAVEYRRLLELEPNSFRAGVVRKGLEELRAHGSGR